MYIGILPPERVDDEHHITLTFNGHGEKKQDYLKAVIALAETAQWWHANGLGRIQITFGATKQFEQGAVYASVISPKLARFQDALTQRLDSREVYHSRDYDYTPHMTLGYGRIETIDNPYVGQHFSVPTLSVMSSAFGRTDIQV